MKIEELLKYEEEIYNLSDDDELAHSAEDAAMIDFIRNCHEYKPMEIKLAQKMFERISRMHFRRWCA